MVSSRVSISAFVTWCIVCADSVHDASFSMCTLSHTSIMPLYRHILPPTAPSLAFIGLPWECSPLPLMHLQAAWVARAWSGAVPLPTTEAMWEGWRQSEAARQAQGVKDRHAHRLGDAQWAYMDWLAEAAGMAPLPSWREVGRRWRCIACVCMHLYVLCMP